MSNHEHTPTDPTDPTSSTPAPAAKPHRRWLPLAGAALVGAVIAAAAMSTTTPDTAADTATASTAPAATVTADPGPASTITEPAETIETTTTVTAEPETAKGAPMDLMTDSQLEACRDAMHTDAADIMGLTGSMNEITGDTLDAAIARDPAAIEAVTARMEQMALDVDTVTGTFITDRDLCMEGITGL